MTNDTKTLTIYVTKDLPGKTLAAKVRYCIAIGYVPLEAKPTAAAYAFADRFRIQSHSERETLLGHEYRVVIEGPAADIDAYHKRLKELE